jgi:hypothetical protein
LWNERASGLILLIVQQVETRSKRQREQTQTDHTLHQASSSETKPNLQHQDVAQPTFVQATRMQPSVGINPRFHGLQRRSLKQPSPATPSHDALPPDDGQNSNRTQHSPGKTVDYRCERAVLHRVNLKIGVGSNQKDYGNEEARQDTYNLRCVEEVHGNAHGNVEQKSEYESTGPEAYVKDGPPGMACADAGCVATNMQNSGENITCSLSPSLDRKLTAANCSRSDQLRSAMLGLSGWTDDRYIRAWTAMMQNTVDPKEKITCTLLCF